MDEPAARTVADRVAQERFPAGLHLLEVRRIDGEAMAQFIEEEWRAGRLGFTEMQVRREMERDRSSFRPRWFVNHLVFIYEFMDGLTMAYVSIDDETGLAELHIHPRPRESSSSESACSADKGEP